MHPMPKSGAAHRRSGRAPDELEEEEAGVSGGRVSSSTRRELPALRSRRWTSNVGRSDIFSRTPPLGQDFFERTILLILINKYSICVNNLEIIEAAG
jgi:hypothetical protein